MIKMNASNTPYHNIVPLLGRDRIVSIRMEHKDGWFRSRHPRLPMVHLGWTTYGLMKWDQLSWA